MGYFGLLRVVVTLGDFGLLWDYFGLSLAYFGLTLGYFGVDFGLLRASG